MKNKDLYESTDLPTSAERAVMWAGIEEELPRSGPSSIRTLHWKSFWIGNAAAVFMLFALIGVYTTANELLKPDEPDEKMYTALNTASDQLKQITPILINQAGERTKPSIESTADAIAEIDRLIDELKTDMMLNGVTPSKESNLRQLYATKLDFYKELLLNEEDQS